MAPSIGGLFTLTGMYATALMLRRQPKARTPDQVRLRNVMIALFAGLSLIFITLMFLREQQLLGMILGRLAESSPIYFMIASVYFENRFEFYDLVVKRALLILLSVVVLGVFLALTLPWLLRAAGRPGAPVAVRRRAGAGGDGDAVVDVADRTLAGSHLARPRIHARRGGQARPRRDAAGHRRTDAHRCRGGAG